MTFPDNKKKKLDHCQYLVHCHDKLRSERYCVEKKKTTVWRVEKKNTTSLPRMIVCGFAYP